jgi:chromosome partitioning protein
MASIVAVANLKGGVGKSTIAVNLACGLAADRRQRVALLDADSQGTAAHWGGLGALPVAVEAAPLESARDAGRWVQRVMALDAGMVVLDCPPHLSHATEAAVGVADLVIIPVTPSGADLVATASAVQLIRQARGARKDSGPRCLLIPSRVDTRTSAGREIPEALRQFGEPIGPVVHQRTAFVDSFAVGQWVGEWAPGSDAHADIGALAAAVRRALRSTS